MAGGAIDVVRAMFAARERGHDPLELMEMYLDPEVEWRDAIVTKSTVRGHSGFIQAMENLQREGYEASSVPETYEELGDDVVLARGYTRLTQGSSFTDLPAYWAFEVRGGKIVRGGGATRRDEALAAVGG
jgi:ketosteroid isomerase-like protein